MPTIRIATINKVVATGRRMKMRDGFMRPQSLLLRLLLLLTLVVLLALRLAAMAGAWLAWLCLLRGAVLVAVGGGCRAGAGVGAAAGAALAGAAGTLARRLIAGAGSAVCARAR